MNDLLTSSVVTAPSRRRRLSLVTLCLATLVAQIDTAVANLATRAIGRDLDAEICALQWIIDSYNLVYAVMLLTGGLLADLYGRRRVFMAGASLFATASLLCAAAPSTPVLILGRVLAGLGAALMIPAALAIIRVTWLAPVERGRVLGIWSGCTGVALAIGPTLGGMMIGQFGWRSIFLVAIPFALAAVILAAVAIPETSHPSGRHFDAPAQLAGAAALGGLAFGAIEFHTAPGIALAAIMAAAAALALFIRLESGKGDAALVPLDLFRSRTFCGATVATSGMTFGSFGVLFLLPLAWQDGGRFDAAGAGIALMPMALVLALLSPFSGRLAMRFGTRALGAGGLAIVGVGLLLIGAGTLQRSFARTEVGLALVGVGTGLATGPLMGAALGAVAPARSGTAGALVNVARIGGATIGVAILGTVFAAAQGGARGLRVAMLLAGAVQFVCAAVAWQAVGNR